MTVANAVQSSNVHAGGGGRGRGGAYRPVGCSYLPVWGVSSVSESDMMAVEGGTVTQNRLQFEMAMRRVKKAK